MDPYMEELKKIRREIGSVGSSYDPFEDNTPLRSDPVGYGADSKLYISNDMQETPITWRLKWMDDNIHEISHNLLSLTSLVEKLCEAFDVNVGGNKPQSEPQGEPSNEASNNVTEGE